MVDKMIDKKIDKLIDQYFGSDLKVRKELDSAIRATRESRAREDKDYNSAKKAHMEYAQRELEEVKDTFAQGDYAAAIDCAYDFIQWAAELDKLERKRAEVVKRRDVGDAGFVEFLERRIALERSLAS